MKKRLCLSSIQLFVFFLTIIITSPVNASIRIMPLGDSITMGVASGELDPDYMVSYRKALWDQLFAEGYDVDFVGSLNNGSAVFGDSDLADHEGHRGWRADEIRDNIYNWLVTNPADIILLHIGTNDIDIPQDPADIAIEVSQILDEIDRYESDYSVNITVILALIINRLNYICGNASATTTLNEDVYDIAQSRISSGDKIEIVDMECGADIDYRQQPTGDMWNSSHPFETGYEKMADVWFSALLEILPVANDNCPDDPNKTEPGACGCGTPDVDTDNDGTPDCIDNCPTDPAKTEPGTCGCGTPDVDTDHDGTPDCIDNCPTDPAKTEPGNCGCGTPDVDSDGDGIPNCLDSCPSDPDKTAPGECGCGVPDVDIDKDGTFDCIDLCPNNPDKTAPGVCGCDISDTDTDSDGTPDCNDICLSDPNKTDPGDCGCGIADTDTDGDGILDCIDSNNDNDGLPDGEEQGPDGNDPNYDGNGDGTADRLQDNVASLHTYDDQHYITMESPVGTTISNCTAVDNPSYG